ncbi:hypothetical protein ACP_2107 [Acidobacterium capsulatum ATCC 51196]|uniref:Uncharacterized protein n=1 Tax=Acidobacterium capsulatum (strain ATCC 51196 / DSM 11244 / BCRC 80197 / JCM 7670 / NBRC 15755 / NCIMB 13165 / 161) TaxID=240015 RepID=C1F942_ACIC5|nr:hypothetical protein ACP_2107 [Acidobacterium capsulatum ATCC 51196]
MVPTKSLDIYNNDSFLKTQSGGQSTWKSPEAASRCYRM